MDAVVNGGNPSTGGEITTPWEVEVRIGIEVARKRQQTSTHQWGLACAIVIRRLWVVVGGFCIRTTWDFQFIADAVFVRVIYTCAIAVQEVVGRVGA